MPISANIVAVEGCGRFNPAVDEFAELVRAARDREGWTQDELATHADVSRASVQNVENPQWATARGKPPPTRRTLLKIARALGIGEDKVPMLDRDGDRSHSTPLAPHLRAARKYSVEELEEMLQFQKAAKGVLKGGKKKE